jgi:hypothetical protein
MRFYYDNRGRNRGYSMSGGEAYVSSWIGAIATTCVVVLLIADVTALRFAGH